MNKMLDPLNQRWGALGAGARLLLFASLASIAVLGYLVYQKSNEVEWAVLYANVDDTTASDVLAGLDAHGIAYKVEGNGTRILVPKAQLATSRLSLAGDGITAQPTPEGFDEIFANQGLASSDFEQRVNYERALEGELAKTLLTMEPVAGARVQLSIPERSIFIGSGDSSAEVPTASVMLSLRRDLTKAEGDTIANVVASSVEGLTADQVTIAAADGTLLRAAGVESNTSGGTTNMELTRDYEAGLSARLTQLARTLTGQPNATVEVHAVLDFTESTVEKEVIDPAKNTATAEHQSSETWTGSGSNVGGVTGVDGGPVDPSGSGDGTYEKTDKTTTYVPGDRTITHSTVSTPTVTRLTVAVVVPVVSDASGDATSTIDEATLARVLGPAAGIDAARGDTIEVALVPAIATDSGELVTEPSAAIAAVTAKSTTPTSLLAAAAGGGVFLTLLIVGALSAGRRKKDRALRGADGSPTGTGNSGKKNKKGKKGEPDPSDLLPRIVAGSRSSNDPDREAVDEIKGDLERMLAESPDSLSALLSNWMAK